MKLLQKIKNWFKKPQPEPKKESIKVEKEVQRYRRRKNPGDASFTRL